MNRVLLYSGGLDSLIAWYYLDKPEALYVDIGHRYRSKEVEAIKKLPIYYKTAYSNWGMFEEDNAHIPGRNLIFGMYAAARGYDKIYLVAQKGEQNVPDRTSKFFEEMSKILSFHFERDIKFINPFPDMTKTEMVRWYIDNNLPINDLLTSISCYSKEPGHCGRCSSCFRKFVSLTVNEIKCRHIFSDNIVQWGKDNYLPNIDKYPDYRKNDILKVLERES